MRRKTAPGRGSPAAMSGFCRSDLPQNAPERPIVHGDRDMLGKPPSAEVTPPSTSRANHVFAGQQERPR